MARRLKAGASTLRRIHLALLAIPDDQAATRAIVSEGIKVIEQLRTFEALARPSDAPDISLLHGRLNAVIDILHLLGTLPPDLTHLAKPV